MLIPDEWEGWEVEDEELTPLQVEERAASAAAVARMEERKAERLGAWHAELARQASRYGHEGRARQVVTVQEREAWRAARASGMSYREIGEVWGRSLRTVYRAVTGRHDRSAAPQHIAEAIPTIGKRGRRWNRKD